MKQTFKDIEWLISDTCKFIFAILIIATVFCGLLAILIGFQHIFTHYDFPFPYFEGLKGWKLMVYCLFLAGCIYITFLVSVKIIIKLTKWVIPKIKGK